MYAEDLDWCYRFKKHGWKVSYCPGTQVIHYGGASSDRDPLKYALIKRKSDTLFIEKHYSRTNLTFFILMNVLGDLVRLFCFTIAASIKRSERYRYKRLRSRTLLSDSLEKMTKAWS